MLPFDDELDDDLLPFDDDAEPLSPDPILLPFDDELDDALLPFDDELRLMPPASASVSIRACVRVSQVGPSVGHAPLARSLSSVGLSDIFYCIK